jgi:hypothetical protein
LSGAILDYTAPANSVTTFVIPVELKSASVAGTIAPSRNRLIISSDPDTSVFQVKSSDGSELKDLYIINILGEVVKQSYSICNPLYTTDLQVDPGIYFIRAVLCGGSVANGRIIRL